MKWVTADKIGLLDLDQGRSGIFGSFLQRALELFEVADSASGTTEAFSEFDEIGCVKVDADRLDS